MRRAGVLLLLFVIATSGIADEDAIPRPDRLRVQGPDDAPIEGALVASTGLELEGRPVFRADLAVIASTGRDGVAENLGAPSRERLVVWAPGFAAAPVPATAFEATVSLSKAAPIDGVVRYSGGSAAVGVTVLAIPLAKGGVAFQTRTDATGRYSFEALPSAEWSLYLRRSDGRLQALGVVTSGDDAPDAVLVGRASVRGRLLDGDGKSKDVAPGVRLRFVAMPGGSVPVEPREIETDANGGFLLGDLTPRVYRIDVPGPEWELDQPTPFVEVRRGKTQNLRPWFVRKRVAVAGTVVDADRKPIEGASVRLVRVLPEDPAAERAPWLKSVERSEADGTYRFEHISPGEGYRLLASAPGFAPWTSNAFRVDRRVTTTLKPARLVPGWSLQVTVRDAGGKPVSKMPVEVAPTTRPGGRAGSGSNPFLRRAVTDDAGRVTVKDLVDDDARVRIAARDGWLAVDQIVPAPVSGRFREIDVTLVAASRLTGRVVSEDGPLSQPVRVRVVPHDGEGIAEVRTDESGRFRFDTLRPVATDLEVRRADSSDIVIARQAGLLIEEALNLEVVLPRLLTVSGFVTGLDPDGPSPSVIVEAPVRDLDEERFRWETVYSKRLTPKPGGDAPFLLRDLPPGPYALRAIQGRRDSSSQSIRLDDVLIEDIELPIPVGARVAGTVLDGEGNPLLGAVITLDRLRGGGDAPTRPGDPIQTTTGDAGAYVVPGLAPGVWRVRASIENAVEATVEVRLGEGDVVVVQDLTLDAGAKITGRVLDGSGEPMDGAAVRLHDRERRFPDRVTHTDQDGAYTLPYVARGIYVLTLETATKGAIRPEAYVEVAADETVEVDFDVSSRGRIEGTVTLRGHRVAGALLELIFVPDDASTPIRRYRARTDGTGGFAWEHLAPGTYRLELRYGSARTGEDVVVEPGDRVTIDIEAAEARLVGRVETRGGRRVGGADIVARSLDDDGNPDPDGVEARGRTSPQGEFTLSGLPLGWYTIEVVAPGLPPGVLAAAEAETAGADRPVTIVLGRGGDLVLTVRDTAGRGVTGAEVWVEDETGLAYHSRPYVTGPGGQLVVEGIPAGDVRVRVHARGFGRPPIYGASISEGGVSRLQIPLRPPGQLQILVRGAGRDPVTRARIDVLREGTQEIVERRRPLSRLRLDPRWGFIPKTGVLVIDELETGAYEIVIDAGATYPVTRVGVDVEAGQVTVAPIELIPR